MIRVIKGGRDLTKDPVFHQKNRHSTRRTTGRIGLVGAGFTAAVRALARGADVAALVIMTFFNVYLKLPIGGFIFMQSFGVGGGFATGIGFDMVSFFIF